MNPIRSLISVLSLSSLALLAAACPSSSATPVCAPNQTLDASGTSCVPLGNTGNCPAGTTWNGASCVASAPSCPPGSSWNGTACVGTPAPCPAGQQWNGTACAPVASGSSCAPAQAADATASMVATQALTVLAQTKAPGMKAAGASSAGMFQAGQCLEQQVTLNPGKCYTAIASGVGVTELDVQLVLAAGPLSAPIAQDQTTGPTAVLGESPNCYRWLGPVPTPAKLVLKSTGGQGPAAVQLFEK